jgi:hypothetical protein
MRLCILFVFFLALIPAVDANDDQAGFRFREFDFFELDSSFGIESIDLGEVSIDTPVEIRISLRNHTNLPILLDTPRDERSYLSFSSREVFVEPKDSEILSGKLIIPKAHRSDKFERLLILFKARLKNVFGFKKPSMSFYGPAVGVDRAFRIPVFVSDPDMLRNIKVGVGDSLSIFDARLQEIDGECFVELRLGKGSHFSQKVSGEILLTDPRSTREDRAKVVLFPTSEFEVVPQFLSFTRSTSKPNAFVAEAIVKFSRDAPDNLLIEAQLSDGSDVDVDIERMTKRNLRLVFQVRPAIGIGVPRNGVLFLKCKNATHEFASDIECWFSL